jgi:hypothetical protein
MTVGDLNVRVLESCVGKIDGCQHEDGQQASHDEDCKDGRTIPILVESHLRIHSFLSGWFNISRCGHRRSLNTGSIFLRNDSDVWKKKINSG